MAKIGRNEPCPCGSGKKYKRCCGLSLHVVPSTEAPGVPAEPPGMPAPGPVAPPSLLGPSLAERASAALSRLLSEQSFASEDEVDTFLEQHVTGTPQMPGPSPRTPLERAQDVMYDAWEANGAQRVRLARQALRLSPDCADAYVLLADETAASLEERRELFARGVAAGERALREHWEEHIGRFWGVIETRPYMRARLGLAFTLWKLDRRNEAIGHLRELLRLNPGDNQGNRHVLLEWLLLANDDAGVKALLDSYVDEASPPWAYGRLLHAFRARGDGKSTRMLLKKALKSNELVPAYLVGERPLPAQLPSYYSPGGETEAVVLAVSQQMAWRQTRGAVDWLKEAVAALASEPPAPIEARVPLGMRPWFDALAGLTDHVCLEHLQNEEYAELSRRMAAALCRKRPSPVTRGTLEGWACGIVYAVGAENFLFDRSQTPHLTAGELCRLFGVATSTGGNKATAIRRLLKIRPYDPAWCLPSRLDRHPFVWLVELDGILVDVRHQPREIQEAALRQGLIPYLPGTRG
ncbi:MAG: SEC-C domain-containing protein [Chloroflexi bacterium]|nr:SEC-C domain-containing protein [Chloroflexota bacterium]